jgi:hypothetical protein
LGDDRLSVEGSSDVIACPLVFVFGISQHLSHQKFPALSERFSSFFPGHCRRLTGDLLILDVRAASAESPVLVVSAAEFPEKAVLEKIFFALFQAAYQDISFSCSSPEIYTEVS